MGYSVFLFLLIGFCVVNGVIVTPFTNCSSCNLYDVHWPSPTQWLLQVSGGNIYRSDDDGQTWTLILTSIASMYSWPSDPQSVLFQGSGGIFYVSLDGGRTMVQGSFPSTVTYGIQLHPSIAGNMLVTVCLTECNIAVSTTYGNTWTTFASSSHRAVFWSPYAAQPTTVFAWLTDLSVAYTTDYGFSWTTLFRNSFGFEYTKHYFYVGLYTANFQGSLYASAARNDPSHTNASLYYLADFSFGNVVSESGYTFLDDTTRAEFIAVKGADPSRGVLFSSDFDGISYSVSLPYIAENYYYYDFDNVSGLPGVYIANSYPNSTATQKVTVISFDNGGNWKLLAAPATTKSGTPLNCNLNQGCSLHLHGILSWYFGITPPFYSSPNAIGLIVGQGSVGAYLNTLQPQLSTYFSRDGGLTWTTLFDGPTIYEFGDSGGILVFAIIGNLTNVVYYSTDEGATTKSFNFTDTPLKIENIICEPGGTGQKFLLLASLGNQYFMFSLNFNDSNLPQCQPTDYEYWIPSNGEAGDNACFMGSTTTYLRRKQFSQCYNNFTTDRLVNTTSCKCAFADYECDVLFAPSPRNSTDGFNCTPVGTAPPCATGYRLVPDTACTPQGGLDLNSYNCTGYSGIPTTITGSISTSTGTSTTGIPSTTNSATTGPLVSTTGSSATTAYPVTTGSPAKGNSGGIAAGVIFGTIGAAAAVFGLLYWRNPSFRTFVRSKIPISRQAEYSSLLPTSN